MLGSRLHLLISCNATLLGLALASPVGVSPYRENVTGYGCLGVKHRRPVCWPQRCQPRRRSKAGTICTYWAVSPSKSGEKRRKGAPSGGASNFSSQQDHGADRRGVFGSYNNWDPIDDPHIYSNLSKSCARRQPKAEEHRGASEGGAPFWTSSTATTHTMRPATS